MRLDQLAQAPLVVNVGNEKWRVPLFTLDDWLEYGAREESRLADLACGGMNATARFQFVTVYGIQPPTLDWLRTQIRAPRGAKHVAAACLGRAEVVERDGKPLGKPEPLGDGRAAYVVANATADSLVALAVALADPPDLTADKAKNEAGGGEADEDESADPLTSSATPASAA